jgi:hypothetical protein
MGQAPPPDAGLPLPKAKLEALEVNKKQWNLDGAAPAAAAPAPKAAAPKAAPKKAAAATSATMGFSGVPCEFSRPDAGAYAAPADPIFLGMGGPREAGHREKFNSAHTGVMLALSALLFQPVSQAGMYTMGADGHLTKSSFSALEVPGFGNVKKAPTIDAFFPFEKTGFSAGPALFSKDSAVSVTDPRGSCGAMNPAGSACHTFLDEIQDALSKKQETLPRSAGKATYSFPWMYDHAAWNTK